WRIRNTSSPGVSGAHRFDTAGPPASSRGAVDFTHRRAESRGCLPGGGGPVAAPRRMPDPHALDHVVELAPADSEQARGILLHPARALPRLAHLRAPAR